MKDKTQLASYLLSVPFIIAGITFLFMHPSNAMSSMFFFLPAVGFLFGGFNRNGVNEFRCDIKKIGEMNLHENKKLSNKLDKHVEKAEARWSEEDKSKSKKNTPAP